MKTRLLKVTGVVVAAFLVFAGSADAHDLFLRPGSFFVRPGTQVVMRLINGTFDRSENAVARNRLRDLSLAGPSGRNALDTTTWVAKGDTSTFTVKVGKPGTYIVGASTLPRTIRLSGEQFNEYLRSDGLPDVLEARRKSASLGDSASERYSKHVKAMLQVGSRRTPGFDRAFGYPAELVPLSNPYSLRRGARLQVKAMVDGQATANQLLLFGGRAGKGGTIAEDSVRTDGMGVASVRLHKAGLWYIKFISMTKVANDSVNYESKWATLTFEVR